MSTQDSTGFTYKDLLLKKLNLSVLCCVLSQITLLLVFLVLNNFTITQPIIWLKSSISIILSLRTWLYIIPLMIITLAQSVVCAKDYAFKSTYCSTRFQKFVSVFSIHNLILALLHILIGGLLAWMILSISGGQFQYMSKNCRINKLCINEGHVFLVFGGLFIGLYFFLKVYISERNLLFPVIHQTKLRQFNAAVLPMFKNSIPKAFMPMLCYIVLYSLWGRDITKKVRVMFSLNPDENASDNIVYLYVYLFAVFYYFNMNLMRFFFNLFLTEPVQFPITVNTEGLSLQNSINLNNFPIIQSLACSDLKLLSQWSLQRRQIFFSLSNPGGHPHNWNCLVENVIKLYSEYTDLINKSTESVQPENQSKVYNNCSVSPVPTNRFRNMKNMSMNYDADILNVVNITHKPFLSNDLPQSFLSRTKEFCYTSYNFLKTILGINFFFGELPRANIQKCLSNGHLIIQVSEGISELIVASLNEDQYGVVQKDLPLIITNLVELKQSLERLNKVPALTRKIAGFDDFNFKMKGAVTASVKRSLFNICKHFDKYIKELPLKKDVLIQLQPFIVKS